jgi:hypothetical protein
MHTEFWKETLKKGTTWESQSYGSFFYIKTFGKSRISLEYFVYHLMYL